MRNSILFVVLLGLGALSSGAAVDPGWRHAADQYVSAAKVEVGAYHRQVDSIPVERAPRYADAKADLERCDQLVVQLGSSDPQHFDDLKAKYEQTRTRLVSEIRRAQGR